MNVGANGKALLANSKQLARSWNETKESWRDSKAAEFEQRYLLNLWSAIERATPLFDQLDRTLQKMRNDCE
jgi:hypothetical protein